MKSVVTSRTIIVVRGESGGERGRNNIECCELLAKDTLK